ncbi:pirin family protein [Paraburkholderia sp. RP-4-7]|jgi:redox-sensitive bicupin YhaK (pirin superfamily)|uniref:Pirin family protein n=1 Tax=Paraburkholderia polaris TaxID=2728848 RepID=A0A848I8B4_9BURK|nr:pirin family protein [Paraburkholderia polaris]NML97462.1 pirin family protein [Paraburkholderia polaris]
MNIDTAVLTPIPETTLAPRRIVFRTGGRAHGGITRLASPSDLGDLLKPFVFLDHAVVVPTGKPMFGMHPHSGIATLTTVLNGAISYQDTTGKHGELHAGGLEWMKAGNGVWHDGDVLPGEAVRLFQLWVALPPAQENSPAESQYISPSQVQRDGPVRVILGRHGSATSDIRAPDDINYFHVQLSAGESWRYVPPAGHNVSWLAIDKGRLNASEPIEAGQLAVFEESDGAPIELQAEDATSFVIGSAIKHPYPLVLGHYSVHTNADALARGEAEIRRIGRDLAGAK